MRRKITFPVFRNKVIPDFPGPCRCYINYADLDSNSYPLYIPSYIMNSMFNFTRIWQKLNWIYRHWSTKWGACSHF